MGAKKRDVEKKQKEPQGGGKPSGRGVAPSRAGHDARGRSSINQEGDAGKVVSSSNSTPDDFADFADAFASGPTAPNKSPAEAKARASARGSMSVHNTRQSLRGSLKAKSEGVVPLTQDEIDAGLSKKEINAIAQEMVEEEKQRQVAAAGKQGGKDKKPPQKPEDWKSPLLADRTVSSDGYGAASAPAQAQSRSGSRSESIASIPSRNGSMTLSLDNSPEAQSAEGIGGAGARRRRRSSDGYSVLDSQNGDESEDQTLLSSKLEAKSQPLGWWARNMPTWLGGQPAEEKRQAPQPSRWERYAPTSLGGRAAATSDQNYLVDIREFYRGKSISGLLYVSTKEWDTNVDWLKYECATIRQSRHTSATFILATDAPMEQYDFNPMDYSAIVKQLLEKSHDLTTITFIDRRNRVQTFRDIRENILPALRDLPQGIRSFSFNNHKFDLNSPRLNQDLNNYERRLAGPNPPAPPANPPVHAEEKWALRKILDAIKAAITKKVPFGSLIQEGAFAYYTYLSVNTTINTFLVYIGLLAAMEDPDANEEARNWAVVLIAAIGAFINLYGDLMLINSAEEGVKAAAGKTLADIKARADQLRTYYWAKKAALAPTWATFWYVYILLASTNTITINALLGADPGAEWSMVDYLAIALGIASVGLSVEYYRIFSLKVTQDQTIDAVQYAADGIKSLVTPKAVTEAKQASPMEAKDLEAKQAGSEIAQRGWITTTATYFELFKLGSAIADGRGILTFLSQYQIAKAFHMIDANKPNETFVYSMGVTLFLGVWMGYFARFKKVKKRYIENVASVTAAELEAIVRPTTETLAMDIIIAGTMSFSAGWLMLDLMSGHDPVNASLLEWAISTFTSTALFTQSMIARWDRGRRQAAVEVRPKQPTKIDWRDTNSVFDALATLIMNNSPYSTIFNQGAVAIARIVRMFSIPGFLDGALSFAEKAEAGFSNPFTYLNLLQLTGILGPAMSETDYPNFEPDTQSQMGYFKAKNAIHGHWYGWLATFFTPEAELDLDRLIRTYVRVYQKFHPGQLPANLPAEYHYIGQGDPLPAPPVPPQAPPPEGVEFGNGSFVAVDDGEKFAVVPDPHDVSGSKHEAKQDHLIIKVGEDYSQQPPSPARRESESQLQDSKAGPDAARAEELLSVKIEGEEGEKEGEDNDDIYEDGPVAGFKEGVSEIEDVQPGLPPSIASASLVRSGSFSGRPGSLGGIMSAPAKGAAPQPGEEHVEEEGDRHGAGVV